MPRSNEPLTLLRDELDTPIGRLALLVDEAGALDTSARQPGAREALRPHVARDSRGRHPAPHPASPAPSPEVNGAALE